MLVPQTLPQYTSLKFKYVQFAGDWQIIAAGQKPPGNSPPSYFFTPPRGVGYWATVANNSIFVVSVDPSGMLATYFFDDVQQEHVVYVEEDVIHIPMLATSKTPGDTTSP